MAIFAIGRYAHVFWPKGTQPLAIRIRTFTDSIRTKPSGFALVPVGFCIKKDGSRAKFGNCGEDSYLISPGKAGEKRSLLAVADGVGGWAEHGGDSSQVSNAFMRAMQHFHQNRAEAFQLSELLETSFQYLVSLKKLSKGTTTVCSCAFDHASGELEVSNIGDSQLVVIRAQKVILEVEAGVWAFNSPNQVGFGLYGEPQGNIEEMAIEKKIRLQRGDIVVLGTDGLFDNLYVEDMARLVGSAPQTDAVSLATLAKQLAKAAYDLGADDDYVSPFAAEAIRHGKAPSNYSGGKPDDISVIVALVS